MATIPGGDFADRLVGTSHGDVILGGGGDDAINGGGGKDFTDGGSGHDWINGGAGSDFIQEDHGRRIELIADVPDILNVRREGREVRRNRLVVADIGQEQLGAIKRDFDKVLAWAKEHKRPISLGEFGAYDKAPMESRARYISSVTRTAEERGWSWGYWQFDSDFILYDVKSDAWVEPILRALIPARHREFAAKLLADHGVPELPPENRANELIGWTAATAAPQIEVALKHPKVRLIANALGTPPSDVIEHVHASGRLVAALCGRLHQAIRHRDAGVDIVIAQGPEGGGHTGEIGKPRRARKRGTYP